MRDWNPYSEAEIQKIHEAFWPVKVYRTLKRGRVACPKCGAEAQVLVINDIGYPKAMSATCDACHSFSQFESWTARGSDFDDYQLRHIVGRHQLGLESPCPHDQTPINVEEHHPIGGHVSYTLCCHRCGASGRLRWS